jgi:hypothetical protein
VVTGTRIARTGLETPTPVTAVEKTELQDMNPRQLIEALSQLPQFFNNRRPQGNAPLFSGGSNWTCAVQALPARWCCSMAVECQRQPLWRGGCEHDAAEGAISNIETVTGGASAVYGTDAVAGVVNFVLNTRFNGFTGRVAAGQTSAQRRRQPDLQRHLMARGSAIAPTCWCRPITLTRTPSGRWSRCSRARG